MNGPSFNDHRREAEEADDLAREQEDLEAADTFIWWVNLALISRTTTMRSMMTQMKKQIIPTRWPGGAVIGIPASRKLSAMANLLAQTQLRARWNNDLGMVEFMRKP